MDIIKYILINLFLFSSWYCLLYGKKRSLRFSDRLVGTFILGLTQIILSQMLLGTLLRKLYPGPLLILNISISICVLVMAFRKTQGGLLAEIRENIIWFWRMLKGDLILLCLFMLFAVSVSWLVFIGYLFPSYSWDALYYHLPIVGQIMQSGAIQEQPNPSFIQQYINIFSKNINLFFLWNVIFLKSDVIVDLGQLVFTLAGVGAVYSAAVKLKIREEHALYSALLFFFTPILILQSTTNYVDGAVSVLFIIALNYLIPGENDGPSPAGMSLLLAGLSTGILLGSKPTAPVFIAVILAAILIRGAINLKKGNGGEPAGRPVMTHLVYFLLPMIATGGYWYIRNWVLHGNPVYYMDVTILGLNIFDGLKADWVESSPGIIENLGYIGSLLHVWLERVGYYMYDSRLSGFGPIWYILFLPAIVLSLIQCMLKKKYDLLFVLGVIIITFLVHPRNWTTRYVIFIVAAGAISLGLLLDHFGRKGLSIKVVALFLAGYTSLTSNSPCIMPEKINEFIQLSANERTLSRHKPFNIDTKVRNEYGYWIWIENNISPGDTLAYTFEKFVLDTEEPFFTRQLWNSSFSNNVFYVKSESYKNWLNKLSEVGSSYILIKKDSVEDKWVEKERKLFYTYRWMGNITEKFRIVYSDDLYKIVEFSRT